MSTERTKLENVAPINTQDARLKVADLKPVQVNQTPAFDNDSITHLKSLDHTGVLEAAISTAQELVNHHTAQR